MPNITSIPAPRVPFIDERTGLISREWYRFMLNLFTLTGSGTSDLTITDLAIAPNPADPFTVLGSAIEQSQLASIAAQYSQFLDIVGVAPVGQQQAAAFDDLAPVSIPYVAPTAAENAAVLAATITAATSKTTPVDADELPITDSAASYVLKKLTWANLKATLATWLDAGSIPATLTKLKLTPGYASGTAGVVASDTPIRLYVGGNDAYGIGANAGGGLDIMANQASQPVRIYAGTNNTAPTLAATISGTKTSAPALQVTGVAGYLSSDGSAGYTGTVTTASLVGQTITIKDGIITNFA